MKNVLILIAALLALNSCTKVIDIDLNSAAPNIVIEAALLEGTGDFKVHITQTGNYFGTEQAATINTASVRLRKANEASLELNNDGNGYYSAPDYAAEIGKTYTLTVTVDGNVYEASSYLPAAVPLDSVSVEVSSRPSFGEVQADTFDVYCHFQDPPGETNFYRIKSVVNGIPRNKGENLLVLEDRLSQGNYIKIPIFTDTYELNDTVDVELVSMDAGMYDYFNTLLQIVGNGNSSPAPTNPNTNWSGGALGYFGAFSSSRKSVVVR